MEFQKRSSKKLSKEEEEFVGIYDTYWGAAYEVTGGEYRRSKKVTYELLCRKVGDSEYYPKSVEEIQRSLKNGSWLKR